MKDLIERQKAINAMAQALWLYPNEYYRNLNAYAFAKGLAENGLRSVPSAQPETGYWISARDEDGRHMWLICSECRAKETNLKAKYCPVCGRKMA